MELHVWGEAFGLPSIDPECLAAISYLGHVVPQNNWSLVASNDVSISPDYVLPALHHDGTWTSGYLNIVQYLAAHTSFPLADGDLTEAQRADALAYASYSLITRLTRPAYSALLRFPLTWTVPLKLRSAAIAKTEHLGLDHLAADIDPEDGSSESKVTAPITATGFLRLPTRPSVSDSMRPEQAAAIRLQSLLEDFFETLGELRGNSIYLFGDGKPTSLDFLAFGYLRLLRVRTPHPFVERCMARNPAGSRLIKLLDTMQTEIIQWKDGQIQDTLPWTKPAAQSLVTVTSRFADDATEHIPGFGDSWKSWRGDGIKDPDGMRDPTQVLFAVGAAVVGLAAVGSAVVFKALSPFGAATHRWEAPKSGLYQFGDIGAIFNSLPGFNAPAAPAPILSPMERDTVYQGEKVEVAVDVEP
ncbi:Mitochondrial outer membrane translocase complex- Tom37/Metaxin [Apiospora phragmitis]|uniref:Mitochondrial outer membrane translocase complex-Tom37/Metaxin n=1 Tax=Apiospora phragmitis TaxID=2905665 RepID=A0ABR1V0R1_9PEZI